ncbi:MAG: alpha/beta hydrolase, partial [Chloroflexi bacterium]
TTLANTAITNWESVNFTTEDGLTLHGWFIPPSPESDGATFILVHGYSANRTAMIDQATMLHQAGYGVLVFDLRNHGESEGNVTTWGYLETADVIAAFHYVQQRPDVNPNQIGLIGKSMGGAAVIRAAARLPEAKLVVAESTYTSFADNLPVIARSMGGVPDYYAPIVLWAAERITGVPLRDVRPVADIAQLSPRPVLIIQGDQDGLVAPAHAEQLFAAAGQPKALYMIPGANHLDIVTKDPEAFAERLLAFVATEIRP